ncbi:hypothetical protein Fmac_007471 [Flemingia macrophylla]|uniref:Uncharacterized protein n=1 Tax=Flemingia macrophylla TaxID=520843 RepID=A0ABD1MUN8_9FABA
MKGVGSYPDWPNYASPNSNLSAFAAPFSINPYTCSTEVSSHLMGPAESKETVPSIQFPSYGYDFFSNPVRELDSSAQFPHMCVSSYAPRPSFVEAQPYQPPYVSSAIHDHDSSAPYHWPPGTSSLDWPSLADANKSPELGFTAETVAWDPFPEFNEKQIGIGSSFTADAAGLTVEERMNQNQGNQDLKSSANDEVSGKIDWEKHIVPVSGNYFPDTTGWWRAVKPTPVGAPAFQPPSMSLETHQEVPLRVGADSEKNHILNTDSYDKLPRHGDKSSGVDTFSSMPVRTGLATSSEVDTSSGVDTVSSMPVRTRLTTNLNVDNVIADKHVGHNNFYKTKDAYHIPNSGTNDCFDSSYLHLHLGRNEPSSSSKATISDNNVSRNVVDSMNVVDYLFRGGHEFQNHCANVDSSSMGFSAIEDVNFVEKSFQDADQCNPAEDSPCWKGSSAAHFFNLEPSLALPQECVYNKEEYFGSVIQPQLDAEKNMKKLYENSNANSSCSPRNFSITKFASQDCKAGGAMNVPFQLERRYDIGLPEIIKTKENSGPPAKKTDCESGSSYTKHQVVDESSHKEQQVVEQNKLMFLKQHTASHHALSSPSSVVDSTIASQNSAREVSTQKLNVQMLVDTMQNLSELLLYHCLDNTCKLREKDCNVLDDVINNLKKSCALKNAEALKNVEQIEQIAPAHECLFKQSETSMSSMFAGDSCPFQLNTSCSKRPQLAKIRPETSKAEFENPLVAEEKLHFMPEKPLGKLSDSISLRDDTKMTKVDNMTQDIKRILSENFNHDDEGTEPHTVLYKNLWLEAEAALCSVYYKARFNQIKSEMDKHSYMEKAVEMEKQSKSEVVPTLSHSQSFTTKGYSYPNTNSALKLPVMVSTNPEEVSRLIFSTGMNKPDATIPCEEKSGEDLDSFIDNHTVSCSDEEAKRNDEASVMARYQVLKARVDNSCTDATTNLEEPFGLVDKSEPEGRDNQNQVNSCQDSSIPENKETCYDTSVVARFHILKSRVQGSSSISSEGTLVDEVGCKGMDDTAITKNVSEDKGLDVHVNPAMVHLNSCTAMDKSIPKEFHLDLEENQESQPSCDSTSSDDFASDWEHVEKSS